MGAVVAFDPLLGERGARDMVRLAERFGRYGMYSQEDPAAPPAEDAAATWPERPPGAEMYSDIGRGLTQRHDAVLNYLRSGGMRGEQEPVAVLAARTNYFREEYAYGTRALVDGIEPFLFHAGFVDAARELYGRPVVEPAIVFANLMVPGQELALHTDVPEFRGVNRKRHPQWLLVAMRHSGLFEEWRMPIATGVAWFHSGRGGEFVFYPEGPDGPRVAHEIAFDTALLLDTDSVFHGVDRVAAPVAVPPLRPGMLLELAGDGEWVVTDARSVVARYRWDELRFSVSWKAYCFADITERDTWRAHTTDLDVEWVVDRLVEELRARGRINGPVPPLRELALTIIDEYIRFPEPVGPPAA